ncbi:MAG TPA: hypothetical protein VFI90_15185 [Rubrobacter sp.]|nr:hypothetical protein [Rubrobacter sp.]
MNDGEDQTSATESTGASRFLESTDCLLGQLRADLRLGQIPELRTPEQRAALARVKEALVIYAAFFYPPEPM